MKVEFRVQGSGLVGCEAAISIDTLTVSQLQSPLTLIAIGPRPYMHTKPGTDVVFDGL